MWWRAQSRADDHEPHRSRSHRQLAVVGGKRARDGAYHAWPLRQGVTLAEYQSQHDGGIQVRRPSLPPAACRLPPADS